jgi:Ni,Fe-hydrogenase III small subunit
VVTGNMAQPLRNTLDAVAQPRVVIAVGDWACNRGVFADAIRIG